MTRIIWAEIAADLGARGNMSNKIIYFFKILYLIPFFYFLSYEVPIFYDVKYRFWIISGPYWASMGFILNLY